MEAKTLNAMNEMKRQADRLNELVAKATTPDELREALRDMCGAALRLETGAHFLTGNTPDIETAQKYIDGVSASTDVREREWSAKNETH